MWASASRVALVAALSSLCLCLGAHAQRDSSHEAGKGERRQEQGAEHKGRAPVKPAELEPELRSPSGAVKGGAVKGNTRTGDATAPQKAATSSARSAEPPVRAEPEAAAQPSERDPLPPPPSEEPSPVPDQTFQAQPAEVPTLVEEAEVEEARPPEEQSTFVVPLLLPDRSLTLDMPSILSMPRQSAPRERGSERTGPESDFASEGRPHPQVWPVAPAPQGGELVACLLLLLTLPLALRGLVRMKGELAPQGLLPSAVLLIIRGLQVLIAFLFICVLGSIGPLWARPLWSWLLVSIVVVAVWSARALISDLVFGIVLLLEPTCRRGVWVETSSFSGLITRRGWVAATLRDGKGRVLRVRNSVFATSLLAHETRGSNAHAVVLRVEKAETSEATRTALRDAAVCSPWVKLSTPPTVTRDRQDPSLWYVTVMLVDRAYALRFDGELFERFEAFLLHRRSHVDSAREELKDGE